MVDSMEPECIRSTGILCHRDKSYGVYHFWSRYLVPLCLVQSTEFCHFVELTDAISEDWGGKPFIDLRRGWQYILDNYPEVSPYQLFLHFSIHAMSFQVGCRSCGCCGCQLGWVCDQVSVSHPLEPIRIQLECSWIQSNPEFGFGFKALFCHDGVSFLHTKWIAILVNLSLLCRSL